MPAKQQKKARIIHAMESLSDGFTSWACCAPIGIHQETQPPGTNNKSKVVQQLQIPSHFSEAIAAADEQLRLMSSYNDPSTRCHRLVRFSDPVVTSVHRSRRETVTSIKEQEQERCDVYKYNSNNEIIHFMQDIETEIADIRLKIERTMEEEDDSMLAIASSSSSAPPPPGGGGAVRKQKRADNNVVKWFHGILPRKKNRVGAHHHHGGRSDKYEDGDSSIGAPRLGHVDFLYLPPQ